MRNFWENDLNPQKKPITYFRSPFLTRLSPISPHLGICLVFVEKQVVKLKITLSTQESLQAVTAKPACVQSMAELVVALKFLEWAQSYT